MLKVLDQVKTHEGYIYLIEAQFEYLSCPVIVASALDKDELQSMDHSFLLDELKVLSETQHSPIGCQTAKELLDKTTLQFEALQEVVAYKQKQEILSVISKPRKTKTRTRAM